MQAYGYAPSLPGGFMAENELHDIRRNIPFKSKEFAAISAHVEATGSKFATFVRRAAVGAATNAPADTKPTAGVPLVGTIHAGSPEECREENQREIFCSEHPSGDSYSYLEIHGDCMNKQVPEGALALFREQGHDFGQTVAVLIDCELMLRVSEYDPKFKCQRLDPDSHNSTHKPYLIREEDPKSPKHIWIRPENMLIRGVFTGDYVMRRKGK